MASAYMAFYQPGSGKGNCLVAELISREQANQWSGRTLTDQQYERLAACIPNSSIPAAIDTIVNEAIIESASGFSDGE